MELIDGTQFRPLMRSLMVAWSVTVNFESANYLGRGIRTFGRAVPMLKIVQSTGPDRPTAKDLRPEVSSWYNIVDVRHTMPHQSGCAFHSACDGRWNHGNAEYADHHPKPSARRPWLCALLLFDVLVQIARLAIRQHQHFLADRELCTECHDAGFGGFVNWINECVSLSTKRLFDYSIKTCTHL